MEERDRLDPAGALHAALDQVLDDDPSGLTDAELHEAVVSLQRAEARVAAAVARCAQVWDARRVWDGDGSRSASARLAREASLSPAQAASVMRRARQLRDMPVTSAALASGELSVSHVDLLARANEHDWESASFADAEAMLVEFCRTLRFHHARRAVDYWIAHADPDEHEARDRRRHEQRSVSAAATIDGVVHLTGLLDPVGGAAFLAELGRLEAQLHVEDRRAGRERTGAQRRADALVEMAHRSRMAAPGGVRPRPLITVLVGEDSFRRTCELADGHLVAPGQLVPLLLDADIERIVFDGPDRVLSVSRRRSFTGALRRAIEVRDRTCTHPSGCDVPATRCDVDHVVPYSQGGMTSLENGRMACPTHNRDLRRRDLAPPHRRPPPDDDAPHPGPGFELHREIGTETETDMETGESEWSIQRWELVTTLRRVA